ncbi:MAG: cytochrome c biogenesis protein CcsA [Pseudomonadota bacterium]
MSNSLLLSLSALAALIPAALIPVARRGGSEARDGLFWALIVVATAGPCAWVAVQLAEAWRTGLAAALWLSIAVSMILFAVLAATDRHAWRLAPLLLGYLFLLGMLATIWHHAPERPLGAAPASWLQAHILVAVVAYGLLTLAAVAGTGVFLQERALRSKRPNAFTRQLPSVADGEALQAKLLLASWAVLAAALATGMSIGWLEHRSLLRLDHKTVLSLLAFAMIAALLWFHYRSGLGGRRGARYVLLAYLLLTLAYPGVKFVTDVLIG